MQDKNRKAYRFEWTSGIFTFSYKIGWSNLKQHARWQCVLPLGRSISTSKFVEIKSVYVGFTLSSLTLTSVSFDTSPETVYCISIQVLPTYVMFS